MSLTRLIFFFADKFEKNLEPVLEDRIEELRHRLRIELAVYEGAKNVIRSFQNAKSADKKTLQEVSLDLKIETVEWNRVRVSAFSSLYSANLFTYLFIRFRLRK